MRTTLSIFMGVLLMSLAAGPLLAADKVIVAHRGASGYLPEHTLAAKAMAHAQGAHYIEQDVVLTKDGVPLVLHDIHLGTVTDVATVFPDRKRADGRYYAIDFTLAEIKRLAVNERIKLKTGQAVFPKRFPPGRSAFKIATLAEEIELIQGLNGSTGRAVGLYTEIKRPAFHRAEGQDISKIVIETLARYGYKTKDDPLYLQCFDWNETQRIRKELGYEGRLVQLIADNAWNEAPDLDFDRLRTRDALAEIAKVADGVGPWMPHVVTRLDGTGKPVVTDLVATAHELGLQVHVYTFRADALPDYAKTLEQAFEFFLVEARVDGLFTDFPDRGVAFVKGMNSGSKP
ncbi:MAG: glycerophosphodiester phosphodiesterase [Methyloligellaceae bacterium]